MLGKKAVGGLDTSLTVLASILYPLTVGCSPEVLIKAALINQGDNLMNVTDTMIVTRHRCHVPSRFPHDLD